MSNGKQSEDSKQIKEKEKNVASVDEKTNDDSNHISSAEGSDKGSDHEDEETKEMEEESAKEEEDDESSDKQNKTEKKGKSKTATKDKTAKVDSSGSSSLVDDPSLPDGWTKRVVQRRTGKTAGRYDVYIFNPHGKKFRSKNELAAHLRRSKSNLKAEDFDFNPPGKENNQTSSKPAPKKTKRAAKRKVSFPSSPSLKRKKGNASEDSKTKSDAEKKKLLVKLPLVSPKKMLSDYAQQNKSGRRTKSQDRNQVKNSRSPAKGKRARVNKKSIKK